MRALRDYQNELNWRGKDLTQIRFGLLVAIRPLFLDSSQKWVWECQCDCGNTVQRLGYVLAKAKKKGVLSSCGCRHHLKTHGLTTKHAPKENVLLNSVWKAMTQRCTNPRSKDYPRYGGRGIKVCDEWLDFAAFFAWASASGYRRGLTIERVDVHGDYSPNNCTWIPNEEQSLNLANSLRFTYGGRTMGIRAWSEECGVGYYALKYRLTHLGWNIERALTTPVENRP